VVSLDEIRVTEAQRPWEDQVEVVLLISNRSDKPCCVLPSEFRLWYIIRYSDEESDFVAGGGCTQASSAKGVSDLDLNSVVVAPGRAEKVLIKQKGRAKPQGVAGTLNLECQCDPAYKDDAYRGVSVWRDPMKIRSLVSVVQIENAQKEPRRRQWVIRPVTTKPENERDATLETSPTKAANK